MNNNDCATAPEFRPISRHAGCLNLTRRAFVASGLAGSATGSFTHAGAANACDSFVELQFLESSDGITVTHYPSACGSKDASPLPANSWFLARRRFGRGARFLLRTLREGSRKGYELQVSGARFGEIPPSFHWFVFQWEADAWTVRLRTELWTKPDDELVTSTNLSFADLCRSYSAGTSMPRFTFSATSVRIGTALKRIFEDHVRFRGPLTLGLDGAGVWHLDGDMSLHNGSFAVQSVELGWFEPERGRRESGRDSGGSGTLRNGAGAYGDPSFSAVGEARLVSPMNMSDQNVQVTLSCATVDGPPNQNGAATQTIRIWWDFLRQDWRDRDKGSGASLGVSRITAPKWELTVNSKKSTRLGTTLLSGGILQASNATLPFVRFSGSLAGSGQRLQTRIGLLTCVGWSAGNGAAGSAGDESSSHHPIVRLTAGAHGALRTIDVPLLVTQADLAPTGCDFSKLTFASTSVRAVYAANMAEAKSTLLRAQSYIWLGSHQPPSIPTARIDLSRARLQVSKVDSLAALKFGFGGLHLEIHEGKIWIADSRETCRVVQSERGGPVRDTRPILVVEFPSQHVFEETVFRPSSPALPDAETAAAEIKYDRSRLSAAGQLVVGDSMKFSSDAAVLVEEIRIFEDSEDRRLLREALSTQKQAISNDFRDFCTAFTAALPSQADAPDLPAEQRIYIGPDGLDPDVAAIARRTHDSLRLRAVAGRLKTMLEQADAVIGQLTESGSRPASKQNENPIVSFFLSLIRPRFDAERDNQAGLSKAAIARLREQATASAMQEYGFFRDYYREEMTLRLFDPSEARNAPASIPSTYAPDDLEYFSPSNREGVTTDADVLATRRTEVLESYAAVVCNQIPLKPFMRGRLSGSSRLAFRLDCRRQLGSPDDDAEGEQASTRLPFTFQALTDWARFDMAVTPRASQVPVFDDAGLLVRGADEVTGDRDAGAGDDIEMLRSLGITSGEFLTAQGRLSEVESSLRVAPSPLETSIELPARLFLSPSQHAIWRTRRTDGRWAQSTTQAVPLWTASIEPSGPDPRVRAVYSPDLRPGFVRGGIESALARPTVPTGAGSGTRIHAPFVSAPPRGPRAPWTLGLEEGDSQISRLTELHRATSASALPGSTEAKFKDDQALCDARAGRSSLAPNAAAGSRQSASAAPASSNAAAATPTGASSVPAANVSQSSPVEPSKQVEVHRLVDYLCRRIEDKRQYGSAAIFRSSLDAYDRHELVLLTSAWGLPVRGRREQSGQLQAVKISSQVELPPRWWPMDLEKGSALYRPRPLKIQELSLSALGGTLRHDTDFIPPSAARHVAYGPLFDSMSVERWQHWTVLGRDVFAEVVYKGYLFPIGHRASLVKQTERVFLRHRKGGSIRAYLRQRMFIRVGQPDKAFPAVGQPNGGRQFPASVVRILTTVTPDLVDPAEDTTNFQRDVNDPASQIPSPAGRLFASEAGLAFWPRTARVMDTDVHFEMQVEDSSTSARLIFVDNVAVNRPDLVSRLVDYYNKIPSPDVHPVAKVLPPIGSEHLRTIDLGGQSRRYCEELTAGSNSHKTYAWTLRATGGLGTTPNVATTQSAAADNDWEGIVRQFDDPTLEGADQPPFYPAVQTARIRVDQVERMAVSGPMPVVAQFEGWYVKHGFSPSVAAKPEVDPLQIYLNIVSDAQMSMGSNGERSGGVFRPGGRLTALSRQLGPLIGSDRLIDPGRGIEKIGVLGTATRSGYPVAPFVENPSPPPSPSSANARSAAIAPGLDQYFPPKQGEFSETKILGLISLNKLLEYIKASDAAKSLPILKEAVEYSAGGGAAADSIRTNVIVPLAEVAEALWRHWQEAGERVKKEVPSFVGGLNEVFPDLDLALRDLREALGKAGEATDTQLIAALGAVYQTGKRLVDACGRAIANPLDRVQLALQQKLANLSSAVAAYQMKGVAGLTLDARSLASSLLEDDALRLRLLGYPFDRIAEASGLLTGLKGRFLSGNNEAIEAVLKALRDAPLDAVAAFEAALTAGDAKNDECLAKEVTRRLLEALKTALQSAMDLLESIHPAVADAGANSSGFSFWKNERAVRARLLIGGAFKDVENDCRTEPSGWSPDSKSFNRAVEGILKPVRQLRRELGRQPPSVERASRSIEEIVKKVFGVEFLVIESTATVGALVDAYRRDARYSFEKLGDMKALPAQAPSTSNPFVIPPDWKSLGEPDTLVGRAHRLAIVVQRVIDKGDHKFDAATTQALSDLGHACLHAESSLQAVAREFSESLQMPEGSTGDPLVLLSSIRHQLNLTAIAMEAVRKTSEELRQALSKVAIIADAKTRLELFEASRSLIISAIDWERLQLERLLAVAEEILKIDPAIASPILRTLNNGIKSCKVVVEKMMSKASTESSMDDWSKTLASWWPTVAYERSATSSPIDKVLKEVHDAVADLLERTIFLLSGGADRFIVLLAGMLKVFTEGYITLLEEREKAWKAASDNAFSLVRGVMLVQAELIRGYVPPGLSIDIASDGPRNDQLNLDVVSLESLSAYPGANASVSERTRALRFIAYFIGGWFTSTTTPQRIVQQARRISFEEVKARILKMVDLTSIREEVEQRIKQLVPSAATLTYDFETSIDPGAEKATDGIFKPKPDCALSIHTSTRVDLLNGGEPKFEAEGHLGAFDITLIGSFDAVTLQFNGINFRTTGGPLDCDIQYSGFKIGPKLEFLQALQPFFDTKPGSGFYLRPLDRAIGLEAGYGLNVGTISFGTVSFFNISLNAAARLRFDNRPATFVASLSRRDAPFTISVAPYGGSGFFALEANTEGIVGFEASFEYGGAAAFAYGPLTGQGRLMIGIHIRTSKGSRAEISATFYAGGTAAIWIFNFGASLYVSAQPANERLVGNATFTFSFSVGIVDYDYHVGVQASIEWSGGGGGGGGGGARRSGSTAMSGATAAAILTADSGDHRSQITGTTQIDTSLIKTTSSGPDAPVRKSDRGSKGREVRSGQAKAQEAPSVICRQPRLIVDTVCQSQSWRVYHSYFDKLNVLEDFDDDELSL